MALFESGTFVKVIKSGRIGKVVLKERNNVTVVFCDKSSIVCEQYTYRSSELCMIEPTPMKISQLKPFVRGEISLSEITNGVCLLPEYIEADSQPYCITAEDLLIGANRYVNKPIEDIFRWFETMLDFGYDMSFTEDYWIYDAVTEKNILGHVYYEIDTLYWNIYTNQLSEINSDDFKAITEPLELWIKSGGKDYPDSIRFSIVNQYDYEDIDNQSEATQRLFKESLDYCCDVKRDPRSIQKRGYCYYCGTAIYPNDWFKARDAFLDYYSLTGDASAANTLGYIYYYGRCNGGVPEYESAFKYFSIGHAYTYFESTYKLADMLAHGYGVVKDGESANHLYQNVYKHALKRFIRGDFEGKFADAALRMGNCYVEEIGVDKDLKTAYFYYLQADYAIRERTKASNQYGDTVVFNSIQKALNSVRKEYTEKGKTEKFDYPNWINWTLIKHRRCKLTVKELNGGVLAIDAVPLKRRNEFEAPMMLITIPKADYCKLKKKIHIKTAKESSYSTIDNKSEIIFDSFDYDCEKQTTSFYLYDNKVGEICTDYYTFTAPSNKKVELTGDIYHFVSVVFSESGRCYDYICDDRSVVEGDIVVVNGYDGEKSVKVVSVSDKYESELGLPIQKYKRILRKI